jgi:predicted dehydrogenase
MDDQEEVAKMCPVKVGVIGLGKIAEQVHLPGLASSPNAEIYAVCDRDESRLRLIGEQYHIAPDKCFQDYMDLVQLPEIQAVDIATPNSPTSNLSWRPIGMENMSAWKSQLP